MIRSTADGSDALLEPDDAAGETTLGPVGHHPPGGVNSEQVITDAEETDLFAAHPRRISGHIHLGDPAVLFQLVGAVVRNQAVLQSSTFDCGFSQLAFFGGEGQRLGSKARQANGVASVQTQDEQL